MEKFSLENIGASKGDLPCSYIDDDGKKKDYPSYTAWGGMLRRCYDPKTRKKYPTYKDCTVCTDWYQYANFKAWYDLNHREGYDLDKDLLIPNNKVYTPEACCFVPSEINKLLNGHGNDRGDCPQGVYLDRGRYVAQIRRYGKKCHIGSFATPEEASEAYKKAKHGHIEAVAIMALTEGQISPKVCKALRNYRL